MTTTAIVQARMSSSRLPGKVLADLGGRALLEVLVTRLRRARTLNEIVVATSVEPSDDAIEAACRALGVEVYRGALDDVLGRFVGALGSRDGVAVRITGDCPLIDPGIVDAVVDRLRQTPEASYASNVEPRTYPDGLDVEAVPTAVLRALNTTIEDHETREHVTLALRRDPEQFKQSTVVHHPDLGSLRWTVDTRADLEFVRAVVTRLGDRSDTADIEEILAAVRDEPSLADGGLRG